jgi:hypothetical protein
MSVVCQEKLHFTTTTKKEGTKFFASLHAELLKCLPSFSGVDRMKGQPKAALSRPQAWNKLQIG